MNKIDARGLSCPAPVLETKAVIEEKHPLVIEVVVDNEPAQENVSRFLESQGYRAKAGKTDSGFTVLGTGDDSLRQIKTDEKSPLTAEKKVMVLISSDRLGSGDDELGSKLMISFIKTLEEMGDELWRLVFVNSGVKLTIDDANTLADLKRLEKTGLTILVCGTCLDHFSLLKRKQVGQTTNMLDIVTAMQLADKVINL